jgi:threonine/homoserine/homoserine lactone efflux protein
VQQGSLCSHLDVQGQTVGCPKAIVFYIAFLPQLVDTHRPAGPQLLVMIGTMIVMALLFDSAYALLTGRAASGSQLPDGVGFRVASPGHC